MSKLNHSAITGIRATHIIIDEACHMHGTRAVLAGGAVRDIILRPELLPKDLDFEIIGHNGSMHHDNLERGIMQDISDALEASGATDIEWFTEYEGGSLDAHVAFVIKARVNNFSIDVILRNTQPQTCSDLFSLYDMSINQCAVDVGSNIVLGGDFPANSKGVVIPTGKEISQSRFDRMFAKYGEMYDFSLVRASINPNLSN